ncbi:MAG: alpha-galactosidase [Clostridia bacterium]|nr:alpha-galactosidase [Clostridia bacterium]
MIEYCEKYRCFFLDGSDFTYALNIMPTGHLTRTYYGKKTAHADYSYFGNDGVRSFNPVIPGSKKILADVMQEYSTPFLGDFREPALVTVDESGSRIADLRFAGHFVLPAKPPVTGMPSAKGGETLVIRLADRVSGLQVYLYYTVYEKENILTRRAEIVNSTSGRIKLERALSICEDFGDSDFEFLTLWGHHAHEKTPERLPLRHGRNSVGNVRGTTSANHANFTALLRPEADEESGEVYSTSLIYSGSHYESVEVDEAGRTRVLSGINPESFEWTLEPGESFETPEAVLNYSVRGLGGMTRQYHDFFRENIVNPRWVRARRPVVLNSWEGMHFSFDRDRLFDTIDRLKGTGIEIFVLDDGWFGARNSDRAGLGDWYCNEEKLPGGLRAIADRCDANGIRFGLWIEPEMVNPDSDLYRAHPDWAVAAPGREGVQSRNQYVLDFSRKDVVDYMKEVMYGVISSSGASYIKWDMNRPLTENMSYMLPPDRQGEFQHRYMLGVYELARYLTIEAFPDILFEGCSGGGGRFDGAMLAYFPQIWSSDNTDADDRTVIQLGTSMVFPVSASSNHVSLSPNIRNGRIAPISTRTNVAYCGSFGYEFDLKKIPADELAGIPAAIEKYRELDGIVLEGDLYRGPNRAEGNLSLNVLVSKEKKRAFAVCYQALNPHKLNPKFRIPGLDPDTIYRCEELGLELPGSVFGNIGVALPRFKTDFASLLLTFRAV